MAEQLSKEELAKQMDAASIVAEREMKSMSQHETVPVARWFARNYRKTGYKRLGRIMVAFAKAMEKTGPSQWANADTEDKPQLI